MKTKKCFVCCEEKAIVSFYPHPNMGDGHLNKCIECSKEYMRQRRIKNSDKVREYDRLRARLPHRVADRKERLKRARKSSPHKTRANDAVNRAVSSGRMLRKPCFVCGADKAHAHHEDYSKPLEVVWLCPLHHQRRHAQINAEKKKDAQ